MATTTDAGQEGIVYVTIKGVPFESRKVGTGSRKTEQVKIPKTNQKPEHWVNISLQEKERFGLGQRDTIGDIWTYIIDELQREQPLTASRKTDLKKLWGKPDDPKKLAVEDDDGQPMSRGTFDTLVKTGDELIKVISKSDKGIESEHGLSGTAKSLEGTEKSKEAWFGSNDDEPKAKDRNYQPKDKTGKIINPKVFPNEKVSDYVQNWKENWLWRTNKKGKYLTEKKNSPNALWKVLMRLKKGESGSERGKYYKSKGSTTAKFLREGDWGYVYNYNTGTLTKEKMTSTQRLQNIKADLVNLQLRDVGDPDSDEYKPTKWYNKAKAIRGFLTANGIAVPDQMPDSPLAQAVTDWMGKHARIKLYPKQIKPFLQSFDDGMEKCSKQKNQCDIITLVQPKKFFINIDTESKDYKKDLDDFKKLFLATNNQSKDFSSTQNFSSLGSSLDTKYNENSQLSEETFNKVMNLQLDNLAKITKKGYDQTFLSYTVNFSLTKNYLTEKEDWYAAGLLARLCMELGCRAEEAFALNGFPARVTFTEDAKGFKQAGSYEKGADAESGMIWQETGENQETGAEVPIQKVQVQLITWKTHHMGEYGAISVNHILNKDNNERFRKRIEELEKTYPYDRKEGVPFGVHNFIGKDDYYLTTKRMMFRKNLPTGKQQAHRDILHAILRHCYQKVDKKWSDPNEEYFFTHPIHALRHIMAQQYKYQTNSDYDWIAKRGHWNTLSVLRGSYAASSRQEQIDKDVKYSKLKFDEQALKLDDLEKAESQSTAYSEDKFTQLIQTLENTSLRKSNPVEVYYSLQLVMKQDPTFLEKKNVGKKIKDFAKEFLNDKDAVNLYNARLDEEKNKEKLPHAEFEEVDPFDEKPKGDPDN